MLGFAPLAAAPLGAPGAGGVAYDVAFSDAATAADTALLASAAFAVGFSDAATATGDTVSVTPSIFNANAADAATGVDALSSIPTYLSQLLEAAQGSDSTTAVAEFRAVFTDNMLTIDSVEVSASTFNAVAPDGAILTETFRARATMLSAFSDSTTITDADIANFLWNVINDSQNANWGTINSAAATTWGTVPTDQTPGWSRIKTQS